jgi:catechol 2,3-dioxygenase-like lactoylglutathione lyase family enzyme
MSDTEFKERQKPETLRLRKIMPSMTVDDLEASIAWYTDVLGCALGERHEHEGRLVAASLEAGATTFLLGQDDWAQGRDRKKGVGFRLYCLTGQDIDQVAADIRARGGTLVSEPTDQPWGVRDFAVEDPDGFKITISTDSSG